MSPRNHALDFTLPIDPRYGIRSIAKKLWNAAATDDRIAAKFATIQERMGSGKPLISEKHYDLYQRLKDRVPSLDIPTAPEWNRPAIAAGYLRAKAAVASGQVHDLFKDLESKPDTVLELIKKLETSFVGEVLAETMSAAHEDSEFARTLTKGADEFRALANELYGPHGSDWPTALAKKAKAECECCRDGECEPCDCWITIIIIITKEK